MSGAHELVPGGFGHTTSHCKHCFATEREIAFALGPVCASAPAKELRDFASLMVDEVIAKTRLQLDAGQSLTVADQRLMLEQLITERKRLATATPSQRLDAATVERVKDAAKRAVELYADSYAQMGRDSQGDGRVDCRSVGIDLRRNVVESVTRAIALATEPHQHGGKGA